MQCVCAVQLYSVVPIHTLQVASVSEIANISLILFVFWFLANLAFNVSLECTSVAANTVLSSSRCPPTTLHPPLSITCVLHSSIWTLVLGHFFFKTPVSRRSVGAAIVCVGGIVLVVGFDYGELKGNLLAVASAVLYSVYSLVLRARAPDNIDVSMSMMFGFIGPDAHILPFVISFQYCLAFLQGFFRLLGLARCCLFCTSHMLRFVVACVVSKLLLTIFHNFSGVCVARR